MCKLLRDSRKLSPEERTAKLEIVQYVLKRVVKWVEQGFDPAD